MKEDLKVSAEIKERYGDKTKAALASIARDRRNQAANGEALAEIFAAGGAWTSEGTRGAKVVSEIPRAFTTLGLAIVLAVVFTV